MLYGREAERAQIGALLEAARASRSGALVVRGEPGIGKSALLAHARDNATDMYVLAARGVESEAELPFAALHQLLRPALDQMEKIPPPQAAALRSALGLADTTGHERFLVFAGCLSLLSELSERRPVLCLIDDAHWLDDASADALRFVARRLDAEGVVLLFGAREGDVRRFDAPDVESLVVVGLDPEAATSLLALGAGMDAAPAVRDRLLERLGGNALALLEVPAELSAAELAGDQPLPDALPMTRAVESIFLDRVRRLPEDTQRVLLVAAADESEEAALVARAAECLGLRAGALDAAERGGLVTVNGSRLEFRHPLVRSALYGAATSSEIRAAHGALAAALPADDEHADRRAWHLAASVIEHDDEVVDALEHAGRRAEERGAHATAARALERAAELSTGAARGRLLVHAALAASTAGNDERAAALAHQAEPFAEDARDQADLSYVLGCAELRRGRPEVAHQLFSDAARDAASTDPAWALEVLLWATHSGSDAGSAAMAIAACKQADGIAPANGDEELAFKHNFLAGIGAVTGGDMARAAPSLEAAQKWGFVTDKPMQAHYAAAAALWRGDYAALGPLLDRAIALARAQGAFGTLVEALGFRGVQLALAQRLDAATLACDEAAGLAREIGADNSALLPRAVLAGIAAFRGDADKARTLANEVLEAATVRGVGLRVANGIHALAIIELTEGNWTEALERFQSLERDPFLALITIPDLIEVALRAGRTDVAEAALPQFEAWVADAGAPWAWPLLECSRAQLADGDEATKHFEAALELEVDARPFDRARLHLLYGEHLRRQRRRVDARVHLRAAIDGFEAYRARPWIERARTELRASGETARKRDPSTLGQLTPQELQIASFVAEGMSNKEVAAQLYLSPRTIDAHLRKVFSKLGITSRTQLARMPLEDAGAAAPAAVPAAV